MDFLASLMGRGGYLPHGYCFTWSPSLLWPMVGADGLVALSYFSIPLALLSFVRKRGETSSNAVVLLFCAFIAACGITHLMEIWTIWQPVYGLQVLSKAVTAVISMTTAVALWLLIPRALKLPSVGQLKAVIAKLEAEINQRLSTEQSLADTQEALVITLASIGAGFIATNRQGRVIRMNAVAEQVTGWTQQQALGESIWDVFERENRPPENRAKNPVDLMIELGASIDTVHHVVAISTDGTRTAGVVQSALTYSSDGSVRGLAMVFRDMTQVNHAEVQASQLAAIVESSLDAIISKTIDGRITSWNHAAHTLFGYTTQEALGQSIEMLIPHDEKAEEGRIRAELAAGGKIHAFDTVRVCKDGKLLDVSVSISPIRDSSGCIVGASKIVRDISQKKQAEVLKIKGQKLEAENRQIQEATRLKSEFLANMSHELRTPLNAVIGFADLLYQGTVPVQSDKHHEFIGHIATSGKHLLQLINDVLDLSKIEAGKLEFNYEPVNLSVLVHEVADILLDSASRQGVTITVEIDPGVIDLVLDAARLKQVLYNYLSNAIKFTPDGGKVTVRALTEGNECFRIEVQDTGIGIASADLPKLFVEFQQLDSSNTKKHQGTGLGLALTRRLVQAQGGAVGVTSMVGVGSVFYAVLKRDANKVFVMSDARRFLVIQDDLSLQTRMVRELSNAGFQVDTALTGDQAIQHASKQCYDAITLDLSLPDSAGLDVLSTIRRAGPNRDSPVVAVSVGDDDVASFSVADVLFKPVLEGPVVAALRRVGLLGTVNTKVMVIDDDPTEVALMRTVLNGVGVEMVSFSGGMESMHVIAQHRPDAIFLDLMMPGFDGVTTLNLLRGMVESKNTPVFLLTSKTLSEAESSRLNQSARAIIHRGGGALDALLDELRLWQPSK